MTGHAGDALSHVNFQRCPRAISRTIARSEIPAWHRSRPQPPDL